MIWGYHYFHTIFGNTHIWIETCCPETHITRQTRRPRTSFGAGENRRDFLSALVLSNYRKYPDPSKIAILRTQTLRNAGSNPLKFKGPVILRVVSKLIYNHSQSRLGVPRIGYQPTY